MTEKDNTADKIAKLEAEVAELKAAQPKPQKTWAEIERENAEHFDRMHALAEKRMSMATADARERFPRLRWELSDSMLEDFVTDEGCRSLVAHGSPANL